MNSGPNSCDYLLCALGAGDAQPARPHNPIFKLFRGVNITAVTSSDIPCVCLGVVSREWC